MQGSLYSDCRRLHCIETFHIHNRSMSAVDDGYSSPLSVLSVASGSADGADCKLVHWFLVCGGFTID